MKQRFGTFSLLLWLMLSLTACGFHLRGHEPLPPQLQVLYIESNDPYGQFTKDLKQTLTSLGITLVETAQAAPITLQILGESTNQQQTSQGASGQIATSILTASMAYQLLDSKGRIIQPPQNVSTSRSFTNNANQVLGNTSEQLNLEDDMRRDLINQLLNRLRAQNTKLALERL